MPQTRILLAEDDPGHQSLLVAALADANAEVEVHVAGTGQEALRAVEQHGADAFDCVVVDYSLPDCDATELLPRLLGEGVTCPTIAVSSSRDQEVVIESIRNGSVDFVPKLEAVRGDHLWRRIELALAQQRRREKSRRTIERRARHLAALAEQDPLTGLANRRSLDRLFSGQHRSPDRRGRSSMVMIDLDHFKQINDRFGHDCGDTVLRAVAGTLRESLQPGDLAVRYGGEEFLIVRPSSGLAEAVYWAETLRDRIARRQIRAGELRVPLSASFGVANCPSPELSPETVSRADRALYVAKGGGRNRVCTWERAVFEEVATDPDTRRRASVERRLGTTLVRCRALLGPCHYDHLTVHARYVSNMAVRLGRALNLDGEDEERLRLAGICHDLGKFLVPDEVLGKTAALSQEERFLLARHPEDGAQMASLLGADTQVTDFIRYHHRWFLDLQVARNEPPVAVPLGARIVAVADAFVAMTSQRPYQNARSFSATVNELRKRRGTQFDPRVVDALPRALLAERPMSIR